jgi:hypothetical protein
LTRFFKIFKKFLNKINGMELTHTLEEGKP